MTNNHHVVIVGGGFGGVSAAKALAKEPGVSVTIVNRTNHHLMQPMLYQVATGLLAAGSVAPALRGMFRKQRNITVKLAEVNDFDVDAREVVTSRGRVSYDTLVVAAGASHSYFGNDQWAPYAPGMKTVGDAANIRTRILSAFELAEQATTVEERRQLLTFAIVGGGPTGVELAGQVAELARDVLKHEFRNYDTGDARVVVVDAGPSVLGPFDDRLKQAAQTALENLGIEIEVGAMVTDIDPNGVTAKRGDDMLHIPARTVLWAAGVAANPLAGKLANAAGIEITDRAGRIGVNTDLTVGNRSEIFAIGDMVMLDGVPGVAQPAIQEGRHVAKTVVARLSGKSLPGSFVYQDKGSMATIGRGQAVAQIGRFQLKGRVAWLLWSGVHLRAMIGTGNRLETLMRWWWASVTNNRRERIISSEQIAKMPVA